MAWGKTRLEAFFEKVDQTDSCWNWTAAKSNTGYGNFYDGEKCISAHRWSYLNFVGEIPEGRQIDHMCNNTSCVNPDHLRVVTPKENWRRSNIASAVNARKTHCNYGHELSGENMFRIGTRRRCRACDRRRSLAYYYNCKAKNVGGAP